MLDTSKVGRRVEAVPSKVERNVLFDLCIIVVAGRHSAPQGFHQEDSQNTRTTARPNVIWSDFLQEAELDGFKRLATKMVKGRMNARQELDAENSASKVLSRHSTTALGRTTPSATTCAVTTDTRLQLDNEEAQQHLQFLMISHLATSFELV